MEKVVRLFVQSYKAADQATHEWLAICTKPWPQWRRKPYLDRVRKADDILHDALQLLFRTVE